MNDVIELRELHCDVVVGVLSEERERTQPLSIDLDLHRPFHLAAANEQLEQTTNYADVLALASQVATDGRFLLLETLAYRVADAVLEMDTEILRVTVAVRKLQAPVPEHVGSVGVRCTRVRES